MRYVVGCAVFSIALLLMGQPSDPISISVGALVPNEKGPIVPIDITNNSSKPVGAYAVFVDVFENGKLAASTAEWSVADPGYEWMPGSRVSIKHLHLPRHADGTYSNNYKAYVDYVKFVDGSEWGPDQHKYSLMIAGFTAGLRHRATK